MLKPFTFIKSAGSALTDCSRKSISAIAIALVLGFAPHPGFSADKDKSFIGLSISYPFGTGELDSSNRSFEDALDPESGIGFRQGESLSNALDVEYRLMTIPGLAPGLHNFSIANLLAGDGDPFATALLGEISATYHFRANNPSDTFKHGSRPLFSPFVKLGLGVVANELILLDLGTTSSKYLTVGAGFDINPKKSPFGLRFEALALHDNYLGGNLSINYRY